MIKHIWAKDKNDLVSHPTLAGRWVNTPGLKGKCFEYMMTSFYSTLIHVFNLPFTFSLQ